MKNMIIAAVTLSLFLALFAAGCSGGGAEADGKRYRLGKDQRLILNKRYCWMESTGSFAYVFRPDSVVMIDVNAKTGVFSKTNLVDNWHTKAGNLKFVQYGTERNVGWSFSYELTGGTLTLIDSRTWNTRTFRRFRIPNQ
jgi:hypothetical protein